MNQPFPTLRILQWIFLIQGILAMGLTAGAATLNVGELENSGGQAGTVPIEFRSSGGNVAALQMDVLFNSAAYSSSPATQGTLADKFRVDSYLVESGRLRVVVGAPANTVLPDSVVFRVPLTAVGSFKSYFPVSLSNIVLSSPQSTNVIGKIAPSIRFTKIADGAKINGRGGIKISSDALADSGDITKVTYFAGASKLFSATIAPFAYTWNPPKAGTYTLKAEATDSSGQTTTKTIKVEVFLNSPPVTKPSTFAVTQNQKATMPFTTLLAQASDPDKDKLIISEYDERSAVGGVLDIAGNTLTYLPKKNYVGKDSFSFAVSDEVDGQAEAKVNLLVRRPYQTDFNGDKHPDLLLLAENGRNSLIFTLKNGALRKKTIGPKIPVGYKLAAVDDFDGDGKTDLFVINPTSGATRFLLLNGSAIKGSKTGPDLPREFEVAAADDFNSDGAADLLLVNDKTRKTTFWYFNKLSKISAQKGPVLLPGLKIAGTDDFNNDGSPDLCLTDSDGMQVTIWYLKNRELFEKSKKIKMPKGWRMAGVTDFSRNGNPDLILYDPESRRSAIWRLNGLSPSVKTDGPKIPSGYAIAAPE